MEYRFRTFRVRGFKLEVSRFKAMGPQDQCNLVWRLTNTGEASVRSPTATIQLLEGMRMKRTRKDAIDHGYGMRISMPVFDPFAMSESTADFFEPNGRVGIKEMGGMNPLLMPGHKWEFEEIEIGVIAFPLGSEHEVHYRIDAEEHAPTAGLVRFRIPDDLNGFDVDDFVPPKDVDDSDD
jgi:hypothetical protein